MNATKVARFVKEQTGRKAVYVSGRFDSLVNSKASSSWGFEQPTQFEDVLVAVDQPSPRLKGDPLVAIFDFAPADEPYVLSETGMRYRLSQAMKLARAEKYFPDCIPADAPELSLMEALDIIKASLKSSDFNWITGQAARDVIHQAMLKEQS